MHVKSYLSIAITSKNSASFFVLINFNVSMEASVQSIDCTFRSQLLNLVRKVPELAVNLFYYLVLSYIVTKWRYSSQSKIQGVQLIHTVDSGLFHLIPNDSYDSLATLHVCLPSRQILNGVRKVSSFVSNWISLCDDSFLQLFFFFYAKKSRHEKKKAIGDWRCRQFLNRYRKIEHYEHVMRISLKGK